MLQNRVIKNLIWAKITLLTQPLGLKNYSNLNLFYVCCRKRMCAVYHVRKQQFSNYFKKKFLLPI